MISLCLNARQTKLNALLSLARSRKYLSITSTLMAIVGERVLVSIFSIIPPAFIVFFVQHFLFRRSMSIKKLYLPGICNRDGISEINQAQL